MKSKENGYSLKELEEYTNLEFSDKQIENMKVMNEVFIEAMTLGSVTIHKDSEGNLTRCGDFDVNQEFEIKPVE